MRNVKMRKTSNLRSFKLRKSSKGIQKSLNPNLYFEDRRKKFKKEEENR